MARHAGRRGRIVAGEQRTTRTLYGFEMNVMGGKPISFASESLRWRAVEDSLSYAARCVGSSNKGLFTTLTEAQAYAKARRAVALVAEQPKCEEQLLDLGDGGE